MLAAWAPELADTFVTLGFDLAVVVDTQGVVQHRATGDRPTLDISAWPGQPWVSTATPDSQHKLQSLWATVLVTGRSRRHEVNHLGAASVPVAWRAVRLGVEGPVLAVGQDLRTQLELQQRFLSAQEALERSYWNAQRHMLENADQLPTMTLEERQMLGLPGRPEWLSGGDAHADGHEAADALRRALDKLHERIGKDSLTGLLRDARRLAEQQFCAWPCSAPAAWKSWRARWASAGAPCCAAGARHCANGRPHKRLPSFTFFRFFRDSPPWPPCLTPSPPSWHRKS